MRLKTSDIGRIKISHPWEGSDDGTTQRALDALPESSTIWFCHVGRGLAVFASA